MWSFGTTMTMASDSHERRLQQQQQPSAQTELPSSEIKAQAQDALSAPPQPEPISTRPETRSPILSQRSLGQLGIFFAGAGFLTLSTLITRRAVARKISAGIPLFYEQSNRPVSRISGDGGLVAVEALGLATLNTIGFGIMATGGASWAFDISTVEELRSAARRHTRAGLGDTDEDAEREIAEYLHNLMADKDEKKDKTYLEGAFGNLLRQKELEKMNNNNKDQPIQPADSKGS